MTIDLVNPATWGVAEKLTSSQVNDLDAQGTYALDKRAGETDTLESVVSADGAGRIVRTYDDGANADTTYLVSDPNAVLRVTSAVTANRIYTLSNTDAVAGDEIDIFCDASFVTYQVTIKNAAAATLFVLGNLSTSDGVWATLRHTGTAWALFKGRGPKEYVQTFTGSGTFFVPPNISLVEVIGAGAGGGGGGAGAGGANACSGGGGGGARTRTERLAVTPGASITVTLGTAGAGGAAGTDGGDGGDTTFGAVATFYGAMGGQYGHASTGAQRQVFGGQAARSSATKTTPHTGSTVHIPGPGEGGMGANEFTSGTVSSIESRGGSTAAALGGSEGAVTGGGGGGASEVPGNVPGNGGGADRGGGAGDVGGAGTLAAGGGGGGGGTTAGAGGAGGPGWLQVRWIK